MIESFFSKSHSKKIIGVRAERNFVGVFSLVPKLYG